MSITASVLNLFFEIMWRKFIPGLKYLKNFNPYNLNAPIPPEK